MSFKIVNRRVLAEDLKRLDIQAPAVARHVRAGQFVRLCPREGGRRLALPVVEADPSRGIISLIISQTDAVTRKLGEMAIGESVYSLLGPLGMPAPLTAGEASAGKKGTVVCIAEGLGIAQILPICRALRKEGKRVIGIVGAKTKKALLLESQMRLACSKIFVTTQDGSYERRGSATDLLKKLIAEEELEGVYAAGATDMMQAVCAMTREKNLKTYVVIQPVMLDCTGLCGACRVKVEGKVVFACVEGPVFDGHRMDFEDLRLRRVCV